MHTGVPRQPFDQLLFVQQWTAEGDFLLVTHAQQKRVHQAVGRCGYGARINRQVMDAIGLLFSHDAHHLCCRVCTCLSQQSALCRAHAKLDAQRFWPGRELMDQTDGQLFSITIDRLSLTKTGAGAIQPAVMQELADTLSHGQWNSPGRTQSFEHLIVDLLAYLFRAANGKPRK